MSQLDSEYKVGEQVTVNDDERRPFKGTIKGPNPKNTAEYEVTDHGGRVFTVHWCYIRRAS